MAGKRLLILGAGGHGKAVAEAALLSGHWSDVAFVDDRWPALLAVSGLPIVANVAGLNEISGTAAGAIAAVGNNVLREQWHKTILNAGLPLVTVIHPSAIVSGSARIGLGTAIMALAVAGVDACIGEGAVINAHATLDHDATMGDFAHLGVGVHIAGGVQIGARAWLQAGVAAGYRVVVPDGRIVPAGMALQADN